MDTVSVLNLVLTIVVCALGIWGYTRNKYDVPLYIGIAYGIFAISHLLTVLGFSVSLNIFILAIRIIGYLLMIIAVYKLANKKINYKS